MDTGSTIILMIMIVMSVIVFFWIWFFLTDPCRDVLDLVNLIYFGIWGFLGLPGAILAIACYALRSIFISVKNSREREQYEQEHNFEQNQVRKKQEREHQIAYQNSLVEKRKMIFSNSPVTQDVIEIITESSQFPYRIEIRKDVITFLYEEGTKLYIFRAHGYPNMNDYEEEIFAEVLNSKLGNQYVVGEETKIHPITHHDGTDDYCIQRICMKMELKVTKTF